MTDAAPSQPLAGLRVLDATQALAGPFAAMILGDLGAEIIKIEPPQGDMTRVSPPHYIDGDALYFLANNRNKQSVVVDLKHSDGRAVLHDLVRACDVAFYNYSPGVAARLALDHATVAALNSRIVSCSITGWGEHGPLAHQRLVDVVAQAAAGAMSITGEDGRPPVRAGVATADLTTGLYAVVGILAALQQRERTGRGALVETSLFHAQLSLLNYHAPFARHCGVSPNRIGSAHVGYAVYGTFATADGWIALDAGFDKHFAGVCNTIGLPDLATDPRFALARDRNLHRAALLPILDAAFAGSTTSEWCARLGAEGVPVSPVNDVLDALAHPQALAYDALASFAFGGATVEALATPLWFDGEHRHTLAAAPRLGEHTHAVLTRLLGYDEARIAALAAAGVIALHQREPDRDVTAITGAS